MPTPDPHPSDAAARRPHPGKSASTRALLAGVAVRTFFVVALIAASGAWYGYWTSHQGGWIPAVEADQVSAGQRAERQRAFEAMGVVTLLPVPDEEVPRAVSDMGLSPDRTRALRADLAEVLPQPLKPRLAWIRVWDSEVEDGDVVRIESAGYSRTVTLTKRGITLAVPVSATGIVTLTGIHDGDGGGITVGLSSGQSSALLPIMSTGQTLRIAVTLP